MLGRTDGKSLIVLVRSRQYFSYDLGGSTNGRIRVVGSAMHPDTPPRYPVPFRSAPSILSPTNRRISSARKTSGLLSLKTPGLSAPSMETPEISRAFVRPQPRGGAC